MDLFITVLELSLPRSQVLQPLGDELLASEFALVLLEGVFEEPQDVFVDVNGQVGSQPVEFSVRPAERRPGGEQRSVAGLFRKFYEVHAKLYYACIMV